MSNKSVCVIDPLKNLLDVFRLILGEKGYEVDTAFNLEQAFQYCSLKPYAVVISEYFAPPEKMIHFFRNLKKLIPEAYCIISTAVIIDDTDYKKLFDSGLDDLLIKPFGKDKLLAHIEKGIRRQANKIGPNQPLDPFEDSQGIVTPGYFKKFLRQELKKARRHHQPFSLISVKLPTKEELGDGFEPFYFQLTRLLRNSLREEDLLGRENGRMGILLQQTDQQGSQILGKRLSALIQNLPICHDNRLLKALFNQEAFHYYTFPQASDTSVLLKSLLEEIDQEKVPS
ncbi:MAG TPA: response regulator [Thermodesulfobacteriota bacterium]|nr:response regulator [Thermodesulfobacteriota bacterium]